MSAQRHDGQQHDELKRHGPSSPLGVVPAMPGCGQQAQDGTGTFSRRALPVPAIALRISVSA